MKSLSLDPRMAAELDVVLARFSQLHPYERAWEVEAWGLAQTDPFLRASFAQVWTPTRIAKCSSAELEETLRAIGVQAIEEPFTMERGSSAWTVSEKWQAGVDRAVTAHEELFMGLAATMFWSRLRADEPSDEMVYDRLVDGEILAGQQKWGAACDCWGFFWESVRGRMPKGQRRASAVKGLFRGAVLEAWAERYCIALVHASKESEEAQVYAERGAAFVDEFLTLFPQTGGTAGWMLHATKGRFQVTRGRIPEGFARFEALVREHPQAPASYRAMLDAFVGVEGLPAATRAKVASMAKKALAQGVDRDGAWGLEELANELLSSDPA